MDGPVFYRRIRTLLHDWGEGYVVPNPFWKDGEIARRANAARDVLYTTIIDRAAIQGDLSPDCCANMVAICNATATHAVPTDFYRLIMGYQSSPYHPVLPLGIKLGAALAGYTDSVWISSGVFMGTADHAAYYRRPLIPISANAPEFGDFADGFYDAVIILTAIEIVMGDPQNAADRLDDLNEMFSDYLKILT